MPELPEVETVRVGLERHVVGRTIASAQVLHPRAVRRDPAGPAGFAAAIAGRPVRRAERRGKYLWLDVGEDEALLAHLGMSGQMLVGDPERPLSPHVRARFTFTDGGPDLRFTDQRTFGHLMLVPFAHAAPGGPVPSPGSPAGSLAGAASVAGRAGTTGVPPAGRESRAGRRAPAGAGPAARLATAGPGLAGLGVAGAAVADTVLADTVLADTVLADTVLAGAAPVGLAVAAGAPAPRHAAAPGRRLPAPIAHIAPDPLEAAFDPAGFSARLRRRRTGVKRALLDQSLISGVGNIYADEALWGARLHWARPTDAMRPGEVTRLLDVVRDVLTAALRVGGTSFDSLYVNVNGESGYFSRSLEAYGREGHPCRRCGTPIVRESFMNRSAFSCPRCQPRPGEAH